MAAFEHEAYLQNCNFMGSHETWKPMETHGPSQVSWLLSFYQMWVPMKDSSLENTKRFVSKLGTLPMDHRGSYMVNDFNVPILGYSPFSDKPMLLKLFPMSSGHP
jgi:hypothetical protein